MEPNNLAALARLNFEEMQSLWRAARWLSHPARKIFMETAAAVLAAPAESERERLDRAIVAGRREAKRQLRRLRHARAA